MKLKTWLCLFFLGVSFQTLVGESISIDPILRVEAGMHTAVIRRISTDKDNHLLATASTDKTAKIWELSTGKLLKTLRVPIAAGHEGKVNAVALSPDGKTIAVAGWTGMEEADGYFIYIFDTESGILKRTIPSVNEIIYHMAYSPDGKYLAVNLKLGFKLYSAVNFNLVAEDLDYRDRSYDTGFILQNGNLKILTICLDGYIRYYSLEAGKLKLLDRKSGEAGKTPISMRVASDGTKLVVGYEFGTLVEVFDISNDSIKYSFAPSTAGVNNGDLSKVTWSEDGQSLYAGGMAQKNGYFIRKWSNGGRGDYKDIPASWNSIMNVIPLKNGGIAYSTHDPSFGVLDSQDRRIIYKIPDTPDFRDGQSNFLVSENGKKIQFGFAQFGKELAQFSIPDKRVILDELDTSGMYSPDTSSLRISNWRNNYSPQINGNRIVLEDHETSRCLSILNDNFILGTEWNLRYYDKSRKEIWKVPGPGIAWEVNLTRNGKYAVAAFGDGTIRWYKTEDGTELLSLFLHKDKKKWVMSTASGYYDTAPGTEEFLGWNVNRGKEQAADFFPLAKFRSKYYRPDIIEKILDIGNEAETISKTNEDSGRKNEQGKLNDHYPPVIEIISPKSVFKTSNRHLTIQYKVRTPSGNPVTSIKVLIDGRPITGTKGMNLVSTEKESQPKTIKIDIPPRDSIVSLIAQSKYNASEPANLVIDWEDNSEKQIEKPRLFILAVGVSEYKQENLKLQFASKDASDFVNTMQRQKGKMYSEVTVKTLLDKEANTSNILDGLEWIQNTTKTSDYAMIYISGHGVNDALGNYYFLPSNFDPDKFKSTGVSYLEIKNTLNSIQGKVIFFGDTCHSANVFGKGSPADITILINELSDAENGIVVFTSSTKNQLSLEDKSWGNGAFTKALVEGLSGKADYSKKGKVTINMLDLYLSERVKELTKNQQTPATAKPDTIADFQIIELK
jgi:WD40 repeat protein